MAIRNYDIGKIVKIVLFANTDWYLYNYRMPLAQELRKRGHEVVLMSPRGDYAQYLEKEGLRWITFPFTRQGKNPFAELKTIWRLKKVYQTEKPDVVHHFTIKCVLYGSIAGRMAGVRRIINAVPGLGYIFINKGFSAYLLREMVKLFYKFALTGTTVIFQNPDDQSLFVNERIVKNGQHYLIKGSGVDMSRFTPQPEAAGIPTVVLPARLLWSKGIKEFVKAGIALRDKGVQARFVLAGKGDPGNPEAVADSQLETWQQQGVVEWWKWTDDILSIYQRAHIVCLPSYYGEGVPRTLIEACACGRPVVATDMPGCREVVRHGENGYLVKPHQIEELADALRNLIENTKLRLEMGQRGRQIVENDFSLEKVLNETMAFYE